MKLSVGVMWSCLLNSHSDDAIRLLEEEQQLVDVSAAQLQLKDQVKQVQQEMRRLKVKYDSLLEESTVREKNVRGQSLKQAATGMSKDEERRSEFHLPSHSCSRRSQTTAIQPLRVFPQSSSS